MRNLAFAALAGLVLFSARPAVGDDPPGGAGDAAEADVVAQQLQEALDARDEEGAVQALEQAARGLDDPALVKQARRALHARGRAVRLAAARALGRMPSLAALDALEDDLRTDKTLKDDEELFALVLKEIGRHGNERSLDVLLDDVFRWLTVQSGTARLMALANIRSPKTVEGLLVAGKKAGGTGRLGTRNDVIEALRRPYRAALVVLTGHDEGPGAGLAWEKWWKDSGKKAGVPKERPPVPSDVRALWEWFWGEKYGAEAPPPTEGRQLVITIVKDPTPEQVSEAVKGLQAAYDAKADEALDEALQKYGGVLDKAVVHEVARGLTSRSTRVRWIAIDVLGRLPYDPALKQLHRMVIRERKLSSDDPALFAHLLKSIGRHGSKSSIDVLTDSPLKDLTYASGRARILGLARVRDKDAIAELIKGSQLAGDRPRRRGGAGVVPRFLEDFRLALWVLTGQDLGTSKEAWQAWWRENKTTFKVSDSLPTLSPPMRRAWEEYWGESYESGQDPRGSR